MAENLLRNRIQNVSIARNKRGKKKFSVSSKVFDLDIDHQSSSRELRLELLVTITGTGKRASSSAKSGKISIDLHLDGKKISEAIAIAGPGTRASFLLVNSAVTATVKGEIGHTFSIEEGKDTELDANDVINASVMITSVR